MTIEYFFANKYDDLLSYCYTTIRRTERNHNNKLSHIWTKEDLANEAISLCFSESDDVEYELVKKTASQIWAIEAVRFSEHHLSDIDITKGVRKAPSNIPDQDRVCKRCNTIKSVSEFRVSSFQGRKFIMWCCYECEKKYIYKYCKNLTSDQILKRKQYAKEYYKKNREKILEHNKKWNSENMDKIASANKRYITKKKSIA